MDKYSHKLSRYLYIEQISQKQSEYQDESSHYVSDVNTWYVICEFPCFREHTALTLRHHYAVSGHHNNESPNVKPLHECKL